MHIAYSHPTPSPCITKPGVGPQKTLRPASNNSIALHVCCRSYSAQHPYVASQGWGLFTKATGHFSCSAYPCITAPRRQYIRTSWRSLPRPTISLRKHQRNPSFSRQDATTKETRCRTKAEITQWLLVRLWCQITRGAGLMSS